MHQFLAPTLGAMFASDDFNFMFRISQTENTTIELSEFHEILDAYNFQVLLVFNCTRK